MNEKIKILHLEDLPEDAELVDYEMQKSNVKFEIKVVDNKGDFEIMLFKYNPDVILSDHSLPAFDSFEALKILKDKRSEIPFILVTATMSEEYAVEVMKEGASDYILKDRLQRLPSAVVNSVEKYRLGNEKQAAHERLFFHVENTRLGFIEWDAKGFAKSWSRRAEEIFGWTGKEFAKSQQRGSAQACGDLSWVNDILKQLFNGEVERNKVQYKNITKDGRTIWCEWSNSVLKDKDGKIKTIMSLVQDISEQKQLEWQKDNFLSIVSHEIKTPLTTIKAYGQIAEGMLEASGDVYTLDVIKRMSSQVNRLNALVQDLVDFTKTQKGQLLYDEGFFDFTELVNEVIDDMQKITFTHKIRSDLVKTEKVYGDKNKVSQVLDNLISNAIKYSPKAASIVVSTKLQNDGIELSVQDFGIGISAQNQKHVFEQFYRVNNDDQSTFPGMGIGLYISSEIMRSLGGKMWLESIIDKGSTFHIWMPSDHRSIKSEVKDKDKSSNQKTASPQVQKR